MATSPTEIAYLTLEDREGFFISDELTFPPLEALGWKVVDVPWNASRVDWNRFAAVVIRSTWDYQQHLQPFLATLKQIEKSKALLLNSLETVRWNIEKTYLRKLKQAGVPVVPTLWCREPKLDDLVHAFGLFETTLLIVKPVVGANADNVFRLQREDSWEKVRQVYRNDLVLVQPFIPSIIETGEFSLVYFENRLSHCILKSPAAGDFRVQEEHGGSVIGVEVNPALKSVADQAIQSLPFETLYARVDMVKLPSGNYGVIEMELIEPSLYFDCDPESPERFAKALDARLRG